ncbi:MAG TPA: acylphosphatase [Glaciihabitans sp.]|nr:acylphosphatase [Glaciihabitans sp.]
MVRKHVFVHGAVQGVGFRYNAQAKANILGISGFTRNLLDGSVELELEGDSATVERMIAWLRSSPGWSQVDSVEVTDIAVRGDSGFSINS